MSKHVAEREVTSLSIAPVQALESTMNDIAGQLSPSSRRIYTNDARRLVVAHLSRIARSVL